MSIGLEEAFQELGLRDEALRLEHSTEAPTPENGDCMAAPRFTRLKPLVKEGHTSSYSRPIGKLGKGVRSTV